MLNIDRLIRWFIDHLFILLIAAYGLLYINWYVVSPSNPENEFAPLSLGLALLFCSSFFWLLRYFFSRYPALQRISTTAMVVLLVLNAWHLLLYMPQLEDAAIFDGKVYFLTYQLEFFGNGTSVPMLAKWDGPFHHSFHGLGETCCTLRLTYDSQAHVVNVVEIELDSQRLAYTDSDPPRNYEYDSQLGDYRYYPSLDFEDIPNSDTYNYIYTVFRCTLENTGCIQLPFRYSGDYAHDIAMVIDEENREIKIYFWIGDYPGTQTLIFTYGRNSRCHIAGCRLLER